MQFQSTLPARGATDTIQDSIRNVQFQSTLPARGATPLGNTIWNHHLISIHAPRTGSDAPPASCSPPSGLFQSTLPARGATGAPRRNGGKKVFQSTLPARGATVVVKVPICRAAISIHAPRTGSDKPAVAGRGKPQNFNPRSPHGERRLLVQPHSRLAPFQSTLPARGATRYHFFRRLSNVISIHAPRTGSDYIHRRTFERTANFNPRSPHGERRNACSNFHRPHCISIHAPRTGSDESLIFAELVVLAFQSTLPARGATCVDVPESLIFAISIHAPRTGSDVISGEHNRIILSISIHAPRTGSDVISYTPSVPAIISIHAPRTGSDFSPLQLASISYISIHAPRTGSDCWLRQPTPEEMAFQSTLPARGATSPSSG